MINRTAERGALDDMLSAVREGESRVLVLRGAAGIGKTAILQYAETAATGFQVLRAVGIESEMELAFAALHQLLLPLLDRLPHLPAPRREALETVFRMRDGAPPDPFLVGLATLDLLSGASEQQPLLGLVDDAHWLDRASAQVLGFVARRLLAESIAVLFAARRPVAELRGLPEREVTGLTDSDAHELLASVAHAPLDRGVRERIVAETHGNPLALIELPRGLDTTRTAGGFGLLDPGTLPGQIEESFLERVRALSGPARTLLLVAAAEPAGDPDLVRAAADRLGAGLDVTIDGTDGLLSVDHRVTFRHPLVRSAVYRAATPAERRAVHLALAEVTDPATDPDRRAWHRASAAAGPDEAVAAELERSAGRAQARGGIVAAAAFLKRSVALTADPARRTDRMLAAAEASLQAGDLEDVGRVLGALRGRPLDGLQQGRAGVLHGQVAFASGQGGDATARTMEAARQLEPVDPRLARETYLTAYGIAVSVTDPAALLAVSRAARRLPPPADPGPLDLLLDGYTLIVTDGRAAAAGVLRRAAAALTELPPADVLRWGWVATGVNAAVWDDVAMRETSQRWTGIVRDAYALRELPYLLTVVGYASSWTGDFEATSAFIAEAAAVAAASGIPLPPYAELRLLSLRGREPETAALVAATVESSAAAGLGMGVTAGQWAAAVLYNGLARYPEAMRAAQSTTWLAEPGLSTWLLPELVEAASRSGEPGVALEALDRLVEATEPFSTDFAGGVEARSRALVADGPEAGALYREAVERLSRTPLRTELARAHLVFGEWLRRRRQRLEAREQLRTAYDMFVAIGMEAFAERARRELLATGETVRRRPAEAAAGEELTAQERQIALLARDGFSNPEVGERLFLSPRTVEWHLRKVFGKLGIESRRQLRDVLPTADETGAG
ncbi:helix-turn-helix transcriptional regulator [Paractinoplanes atraurantiacus]|uniref:ATP-, maltotriose- and DNA-dependent transcriptional regulator MalT n=1 Tax=Paractinoplanes atraurantiacus TaxID=1036182 RepID=A0A285JRN8_9ACTN|nr:helix-turn-helix transcriptional regulator [Actinoplanes atraurantiacus]SNY62743.1 ATP-, maltotriose- and DNA-dependent transcriptional regulator MalT [Actinoplanes atraurantiacus]